MKKENIYKFLYAVCILLIIGFCIRIGIDYSKYNQITNSSPFYIFIIVRTIEFILPSIIVFIIGHYLKNK